MAFIGNKGFYILDADVAPTFDPTSSYDGGVASVAGTEIMYFHSAGTTWTRIDIGALSGADGNQVTITRGDAITGVAPTLVEVPAVDLDNGDTATIYLNNGTMEYWAYNGAAWALAFTTDAQTLTTALNTLTGVAAGATDLGTFTGTVIGDNLTIKDAFQALETEIETYTIKSATDTNSIDFTVAADVLTADVKLSATQDNEFFITESADGLRITKQTIPSYTTHAAATADGALTAGSAYSLVVANFEGVPSTGTAPVYRK